MNLVYLLLALGLTKEERDYLLNKVDITKPESIDKLREDLIDYLNDTYLKKTSGLTREELNSLLKRIADNIQ